MTDKVLCVKFNTANPINMIKLTTNPADMIKDRWLHTKIDTLVQSNLAVLVYQQVIVAVVQYDHQVRFKEIQTAAGNLSTRVQLTDVFNVSDDYSQWVGMKIDHPTTNPVTLISKDLIKRGKKIN